MTPAELADDLDQLLDDLTSRAQRTLEVTNEHREAIRAAEPARVARAVKVHQRLVQELRECEQRRASMSARAIRALPGAAHLNPSRTSLSELAKAAEESRRATLLDKAQHLRGVLAQVQRQSSGVRIASQSLLAHMEGLLRQVGRQLSHAGTYSRRGLVEPVGLVVSALDLRS